MDDEGNPKEFLTPLERKTFNALRDGEVADSILELVNLEFHYDAPINKGYRYKKKIIYRYILDLPLEQT